MRTEVKRSLLLWPAAASATITAISWFTIVGPEATYHHARSAFGVQDPVVLHDDVGAVAANIELSARSKHGARAMKLPERVAGVFGVDAITLKAPVRDQHKELAGLVLRLPSHEATDEFTFGDSPRSDALAAGHITSDELIPSERAIGAAALQGLRNREYVQAVNQRIPPEHPGSPLVGPGRPESWEPKVEATDAPTSMLPQSNRALGKRSVLVSQQSDQVGADSRPSTVEESIVLDTPPVVTIQVSEAVANHRSSVEGSPASWPITQRLDEQLQALSALAMHNRSGSRDQLVSSSASQSPIVRWTEEVSRRLIALRSLPRLGDPRAGSLIEELSELATEGERGAEDLKNRQQQIEWLRASYAVARRVAVWRPVWGVTNTLQPTWMVSDEPIAGTQSIRETLESVRADLHDTGDVTGWTVYLLLDEIENATTAGRVEQRTILAQRYLSRLAWHALDPEHLRWLQRESIMQLASAIRPWARGAVDYANLMSQIERQESDTIDLAAIDIADAVQTLRFADNPKAVRVADAITTHYRNANVRLAISQPMLQRMLPSIDPTSVPVRTRVFGSRVRGISRIESDLKVELSPSADSWSLKLKTFGNVQTQSTGVNGPVAIRTSGKSQFVAATPIQVNPRGVQIAESGVDVQGRTRLRGIRSDYDGWPMIGSLVRSIAASRYDSLAGRSNRIANQKIERQVGAEINTQVDQRIGVATEQLSEMVLGPLSKLRLDPKVTDMQTTDQRLLARYRLAGDWQLAAFTPRPRAPQTSLMSVQVHQSALNNTLEQLVPRDEPMLIRDVIRNGAKMFGKADAAGPEDIPEDVTVLFAPTRPITVEIEDGLLWVTLRIVRLTRGDRSELTRFIVRAAYKPKIDGIRASLVRDGHLRISGPRMSMRERLPVRAIFNKVLSPNRTLQLTLPQMIDHPATQSLAVSQLEMRGGWIAMAVSESDAPRIALVEQ